MMRRCYIFIIIVTCLCLKSVVAFSRPVADTTDVHLDSVYVRMFQPKQDTAAVFDRGFDVGRYVGIRRQRAHDHIPFSSESFLSNTFISVRVTTPKIMNEDYSFGLSGGVSFGKWLHEDHAVRVTASLGGWKENHKGNPVASISLDASYMFDFSSYVGGYRPNRFFEILAVAGLGYSNAYYNKAFSHALNLHAGANLNFRIFKNLDFFLEPLAVVYTNGMAVSYAGNWRSWLSSVHATFGFTYNMRDHQPADSPRLYPRSKGWFVTVLGGPQFQNSRLVYDLLGVGTSLGVHLGAGIGKYYTDWFAMRYTASFSRSSWVMYEEREYPSNYFTLRAEAVIDLVGLIRSSANKEGRPLFSAAVIVGPEAGYMYKVDREESPAPVISTAYVGLTGGFQAKFNIGKRLSLFAEPRFSVIPYDAPSHVSMSNKYRNYYDGLINLNLGIEYLL